jgi:ketosteroid isomerase-like protein
MKNNLEIIKSTYEGASPEITAQNTKLALADNATWTEAAGFPYAGTYIGFEAIRANVFEKLATEWIDYKVIIEDYLADGNKVMAYGKYTGTYRKTNKYFEARVAHLWKLDAGKIISFEQFVDSKIVFDTLQ